MEILPIDPNQLLAPTAQQGPLFGFMLFVIVVLLYVAWSFYQRNIKQGEDNAKALMDSTLAINNNTMALNALIKEIERINDAR